MSDSLDWYDQFLTDIGIDPGSTSSFSNSPTNQEILDSIYYNPTATGGSGGGGGGIGGGAAGLGLAAMLGGLVSNPATLLPLLGGLSSMMGSNSRTQPAGYQGGIPRLVATRQQPKPGQMISGDVVYTPRPAPAPAAPTETAKEGGEINSGGFIIPADVVSGVGNGSSDAGLKYLAAKLGATPIKGEGDGMSDSIPTTIDGEQKALVAHEEAYVSPEKVARLGNGDMKKGAKKLRDMMEQIRMARTGTKEQGKEIDPAKFMPGGEVKRYAAGDGISGAAISSGLTGTESNLSNWAGPYVTEMLGKGQALSEMPYEAYTGQRTAGQSGLQSQAFTQASGLQTPAAIGQGATTAGNIAGRAMNLGYTPVGAEFTTDAASRYMNPYLKSALEPQMAELNRQAEIKRMEDAARMTKAGAYGGGRQAVLEAEGGRNLMDLQRKVLGEGYSTAYDKAMAQFNADQARKVQEAQYGSTLGLQGLQAATQAAQTQGQLGSTQQQADLAGLRTLADLGATQRGIESEMIAADKAAFEEARLNPFKMVQFQQSLLQGLPLAAQTYNLAPTNNLSQFAGGISTVAQLLGNLGIKP